MQMVVNVISTVIAVNIVIKLFIFMQTTGIWLCDSAEAAGIVTDVAHGRFHRDNCRSRARMLRLHYAQI